MRSDSRAKAPGECLIFWDYDTQWGVDRWRGPTSPPANLGTLEFEYTERLLELHAEHGVPCCFAVVGAAALPGERPYHDPSQIRRIHAAGHEVGSHSFRHEWLPGLSREELRETLRASRDALEQCIGAPVGTFVLPFNQPFDYLRGFSVSRSERREAKTDRQDLASVCKMLAETGYRFCRVAYRSILTRIADRLRRTGTDRPVALERIAGITCVRLGLNAGFDAPALDLLDRCARSGGVGVFYGHPHSLRSDNPQHERFLIPFLSRVRKLVEQGAIRVRLPREIA